MLASAQKQAFAFAIDIRVARDPSNDGEARIVA